MRQKLLVNREYCKWYSPNIGREMELLVFGDAGARVLVFPTRTGRFYDYEDWRLLDSVRDKIEAGLLQLYCVDSIDCESLYSEYSSPVERINRHLHYQSYILDEVIPLSLKKNQDKRLVAHGCSLGAYHAMNIALRHPNLFNRIVAFSGRYDLTVRQGPYRNLMDMEWDGRVYFNNPSLFLPNLTDEKILAQMRRMDILFTIGDEDPFLEDNQHLSVVMTEKRIKHQCIVWEGEAHRPRYWREMVRLYL